MADYHKNWYRDNRERILEKSKTYYQENRDAVRSTKKKYYDNHSEERKAKDKNNYRNNPNIKRDYQLRKRFGISLEEYNQMLESQNGCCAICKTHHTNLKVFLGVDHNHATGKIRKLLCNHCNAALGMVKEDISILESMIEYLRNN